MALRVGLHLIARQTNKKLELTINNHYINGKKTQYSNYTRRTTIVVSRYSGTIAYLGIRSFGTIHDAHTIISIHIFGTVNWSVLIYSSELIGLHAVSGLVMHFS